MTKNLFFVAVCLLSGSMAFAQVVDGEESKLMKLWEKEKYEDIAYKADAMTDKDRKNAELYLWGSMAWYEVSQSTDPKVMEYYKDPFKDALKSAGKFVKYDKDNLKDSNMDYLNMLKKTALEQCTSLMKEGDYRKATYTYKYLTEIFPMDDGILYMKGVADAHNNNTFEAERTLKAAIEGMKMDYVPDDNVKPAMAETLVMFSDLLVKNEYPDSAKAVLNMADKYVPNNDVIKAQISKLAE